MFFIKSFETSFWRALSIYSMDSILSILPLNVFMEEVWNGRRFVYLSNHAVQLRLRMNLPFLITIYFWFIDLFRPWFWPVLTTFSSCQHVCTMSKYNTSTKTLLWLFVYSIPCILGNVLSEQGKQCSSDHRRTVYTSTHGADRGCHAC